MKKKIFRLLVSALAVVFVSCTKNDDTTIVPLGTESYIDEILGVIPDSTMQAFETAFGAVPRGYIPANVEGDYVIAPKERVASNVEGWMMNPDPELNVSLSFSEQHNGVVRVELSEAIEQLTDTAFVMGTGNAFTVYFVENKSYDVTLDETFHVNMERGVIIKGNVNADGISNLYFAVVILKVEDDFGGIVPHPGSYFVYRDGNGLASRL